jgi:hypothetical protein
MSFLLPLMFSLQQNQRMGWGGEVVQTMYTHVSKCKNDNIKKMRHIISLKIHIIN